MGKKIINICGCFFFVLFLFLFLVCSVCVFLRSEWLAGKHVFAAPTGAELAFRNCGRSSMGWTASVYLHFFSIHIVELLMDLIYVPFLFFSHPFSAVYPLLSVFIVYASFKSLQNLGSYLKAKKATDKKALSEGGSVENFLEKET